MHTGQMRGFASHSANMLLRQFSSNCKLFSYSLMMDFSARQKARDCLVPVGQVYSVLQINVKPSQDKAIWSKSL